MLCPVPWLKEPRNFDAGKVPKGAEPASSPPRDTEARALEFSTYRPNVAFPLLDPKPRVAAGKGVDSRQAAVRSSGRIHGAIPGAKIRLRETQNSTGTICDNRKGRTFAAERALTRDLIPRRCLRAAAASGGQDPGRWSPRGRRPHLRRKTPRETTCPRARTGPSEKAPVARRSIGGAHGFEGIPSTAAKALAAPGPPAAPAATRDGRTTHLQHSRPAVSSDQQSFHPPQNSPKLATAHGCRPHVDKAPMAKQK